MTTDRSVYRAMRHPTRSLLSVLVVLVLVALAAPGWADEPAPPPDGSASATTAPVTAGSAEVTGAATGSAAPALVPAEPEPEPPKDKLTFAGSVQLDYLAVPTNRDARLTTLDGATVELSLRMTKDFGKNATASIKVCFACHGFEAGMGYVELRAADELRLRVGRMTPAFGSFPQRHDPANHMTSDKPLPYDMGRMLRRNDWDEGILPAPWVDNGLEIAGTHFWHGGQVDYAVYAVSGPKGSPDAADFDFTLSRAPEQYYVDNNSEPSLGARVSTVLDISDDVTLTVGASGMAGHYDPARKLGFAIAGADAAIRLGANYLRAEYLIRRTEMSLGDDPASRFKYGADSSGTFANYFLKDGFYLEAEVPVGRLSILARWDGLRRAGNVLASSGLSSSASLLRYTGGFAFRLKSKIVVKTSFELYRFSDFANELAIHTGVATPF